MNSYGVIEKYEPISELDLKIEELKNLGYTTLRSRYSEGEIKEIRDAALDVELSYKNQYQNYRLDEIGEANSFRAPGLMNPILWKPASNRYLQELLTKMIAGKHYLNQQNLVINPPNSDNYSQLRFHRDLPYQHYVSSRPLAINALYAVDDFTIENGATYVVPASHKSELFPSDNFINNSQIQIPVKAGTFLVLDCMLYHAAASNRTISPRIGLNHVYSTPMLRPQIEWAKVFSENSQIFPTNANELLGLDFTPPTSVAEFLSNRRNK